MKVLVTGGAGFIGSNIWVSILEQYPGADICVLDDMSSAGEDNISDFKGEFIKGNVANSRLISSLAGKGFDCIFHQAAITDTIVSDRDLMMGVNVDGHRNILQLALKERARVVYASSAGVYGNGPIPMKEDQELSAHNLYAESKILADGVTKDFIKEQSNPVVGLRYFNVYGPREQNKKKAMSMIRQLAFQMKDGKNPRIFKMGEQARDFIYVKDIVLANMKAMEAKGSCIVNVGTGKKTTFNRLIEIINSCLNTNYKPEYFDNTYGFYQDFTQADTTLAKEKIGFTSQYSIEEGIKDYLGNIIY